ncbi:MAG: hypothetical protein ABEK29_07705, partial [Bradymonadaceae bacterium]
TSGTFQIEGQCGEETVTREVEVDGDECGPNTEEITLTFPDGACGLCDGASPNRDTGAETSDTPSGDVSDAGR